MTFFTTPDGPCVVCGEELPEKHFAECMACMQPYHMRMTENAVGMKDCGITYIDETDLFMVFLCGTCAEKQQASPT